jgi:hypothetical protein
VSSEPLVFEPATHRYSVGEEVLVSVTQALKLAGVVDYSMIPQDILRAAAERGTYVHKMIQYWLDGELDLDKVPGGMLGYLDAARRFLDQSRFEAHRVECRDWNPTLRYAGTWDVDGGIGASADPAIVDWKTGMILDGHAPQLAGYSLLKRNPRSYRRIAVKLNADGTFRAHEFPSPQHPEATFARDTGIFQSALTCAKWNIRMNGATT